MNLFRLSIFFLISAVWVSLSLAEPATERIVLSAPGPRNLSYLPIDLIPKIGADRQEGASLQILHTGGGAVALDNLVTRNADFAVAGVPAVLSIKANGADVAILMPVDDAPLFVLMVRAGLQGSVKTIADLKGKTVGVNTSTQKSKTTSQQLAELLLQSGGILPNQVHIVPAGQSWVEQSSLLITGTADAVMGDEPFASRLLADKQVFFLANLADPATVAGIKGSHFLHAALETRGELIQSNPSKIEKMTRMLRTTLQWMAAHTPEEIVAKLDVTDPLERESLRGSLAKYPNAFSKDGKFSTKQLTETDVFFHASSQDDAKAMAVKVEELVNDHWAGHKE